MPTSTGKIYLGSNLLSGGSSAVVAPTSTPWVRNPLWYNSEEEARVALGYPSAIEEAFNALSDEEKRRLLGLE